MDQPQKEIEIGGITNMDNIEIVLKAFWEKARFATDLISRLRDEKHALQNRQVELESELQKIRNECSKLEQDLKRLKTEHAYMQQSIGDNTLSSTEKDELKNKIRDLIAKINSHL